MKLIFVVFLMLEGVVRMVKIEGLGWLNRIVLMG